MGRLSVSGTGWQVLKSRLLIWPAQLNLKTKAGSDLHALIAFARIAIDSNHCNESDNDSAT